MARFMRQDASAERLSNKCGLNGDVPVDGIRHMWEKCAMGLGPELLVLMRASIGDILAAPGGREAMFQILMNAAPSPTAFGASNRGRPLSSSNTALITTVGSPL